MRQSKGFTLVEILVSLSILTVILALGLFISMDFFRSYSFHSEQSVVVSLLQNARSQSMNNINQTRHGVHFADPLKYIIFECKSSLSQCVDYANRDASKDLVISPSYNNSISSPALPFDVIFDQLNGNCVTNNCSTLPLSISAFDGAKTYVIKINNQGQIDW